MTVRVREWLPREVMNHGGVRKTIEQAIAQWNAQWFLTSFAEVAGTRVAVADSRPESEGTGWRVYRAAIAIRGSRAGLSRLVNRALDLRADLADLTAADRYVMNAIEGKILEGLAETLEVAFGVRGQTRSEPDKPADPLADGGGLVVSVVDPSGREVLTLALPGETIVRHVKASIPRTPGKGPALRPFSEALAEVNIPVEAQVGKVELTLAELNELAVGDVLVLDKRLDEAVDIAGVRSGDVFAKAVLTHVEDGLVLVFNS